MKLPKTVTGKVFVLFSSYTEEVMICSADMSSIGGYALLGEVEVTVDVPQVDPTLKMIEGLENRAEDIQAEATAAVRMIMEQIKQLQCLEHNPGGDV